MSMPTPTRTTQTQPQWEPGRPAQIASGQQALTSHVSDPTVPHATLLHLQRTAGNQAVSQVIQARLREDQPGNADSQGQAGLEHATQSGHLLARIPISPSPNMRANNTGLPDAMKVGVETLSGLSMDDVRVYYNSSKPAQLEALAYTQGTDIHVGPGQEQHLAHEAWHVVQQKQRRVKPTVQAKEGTINDDQKLESEADTMSARANTEQRRAMQNARSDRGTSELTHVIPQTGGQVGGNKAQPELAQQSSLSPMGQHQRNVIQMRTIRLNDGKEINTNRRTRLELLQLYSELLASDPNGAEEILQAILSGEFATPTPLAIGLSSGPTGNIFPAIGGLSRQPPVSTSPPPVGNIATAIGGPGPQPPVSTSQPPTGNISTPMEESNPLPPVSTSQPPTDDIATALGGPSPQPPVSTSQPPIGGNKDYNRKIWPLIGFMGYRFGQGQLLTRMGGKGAEGYATSALSALINSKALLKAPRLVKGATAAFVLASALTMLPLNPLQLLLETRKKGKELLKKVRGKE